MNQMRSANKAYYESKTPLLIRGTREGRKNPQPNRSYIQKPNDVSASTNKYYAEMGTTPGQVPQTQQKAPGAVRVVPTQPKILRAVVQAFQQGAGSVRIEGPAAEINQARTAIDLAVGRKILTRKQVDLVSFVSVMPKPAPEPATPINTPTPIQEIQEQAAVPVTSDPPRSLSDQAMDAIYQKADQEFIDALNPLVTEVEPVVVESEETEVSVESEAAESVTEKEAETNQSGMPEADEILNAPVESKSVTKRKSRQKKDDAITEQDIASAFGVADDTDD